MILTMIMLCAMLFQQPTVYDFSFKTIEGKEMSLADFKDQQILIVNTASKCGFTKQYKELQALHEQYGDKIIVIGFPSDNFGNQEFESNEEIADFCEKNFGVNFILAEKVDVKGEDIDPLFKYLTNAKNPDFTGEIKWNFEKFLINKKGELVHRFRSKVNPMDKLLTSKII